MNILAIFTALSIIIIPVCGILKLNPPVWYGQYIGLIFCSFLGISLSLWKFNKYISIFTIICLLNTFFVAHFAARAMLLLFQVYISCLAIYGISKFNQKQRKYVLYGILTIFGLSCFYLVVQYFNKDPFFFSTLSHNRDELVAFFGAKDQLGSFFALTAPIAYFFNPYLSILSILGLFISHSSFAFVSAIISLGLYVSITNKNKIKYLIVGLFIVGVLFFRYGDDVSIADFGTRGAVWNEAIKDVFKQRITIGSQEVKGSLINGYGLGNFLNIFPYIEGQGKFNYSNEKFTHAHNDYIEVFSDLGLLGLLSILILLFNFVYRFIKSKKNKELVCLFCSIIAYLLNASGNFLTHLAYSGAFLIILVGLYEATRRELNG